MSIPKELNNIDQAVWGLIVENFFKYKKVNPTGVWLEDFHVTDINYREVMESLFRLKGREYITYFKFGYGGIALPMKKLKRKNEDDVGAYIVDEEDPEDMEHWALFQIKVKEDALKVNKFKPSRNMSIDIHGKLYVGKEHYDFLEENSARLRMFLRLVKDSDSNRFISSGELKKIGNKNRAALRK